MRALRKAVLTRRPLRNVRTCLPSEWLATSTTVRWSTSSNILSASSERRSQNLSNLIRRSSRMALIMLLTFRQLRIRTASSQLSSQKAYIEILMETRRLHGDFSQLLRRQTSLFSADHILSLLQQVSSRNSQFIRASVQRLFRRRMRLQVYVLQSVLHLPVILQ